MKCEQNEELFISWIDKDITPAERQKLYQHAAGCAECAAELEVMQEMWGELGDIQTPEPSAHMQVKFNAMLDTFKAAQAERNSPWTNLKNNLNALLQWQPRWPMAYNLAVMLICFGLGFWFFRSTKGNDQQEQMKALAAQVHELKQTMMLALLENPSASERIRGVSYTSEIKNADQQVIDALLTTLNNDDNVNVRLSTLDALAHMAKYPEVREGLIKSIAGQDSPLMQSAIADVMLKLQEKRAVGSFKKLLKQKNLDNGVRDKITQTIKSLI